ncbi:MAG: PqqD family protein [Thermodesulfovibrionales bacterium]|nr:PqqD family protein [Thermodesulfovibrionales bacterium]
MLEVTDNSTWVLSKDFVLKSLDPEKGPFWVFNVQTGSYFELNKTAFFILSCFNKENTIKNVLDIFIARYPKEDKEILVKDFKEATEPVASRKNLHEMTIRCLM